MKRITDKQTQYSINYILMPSIEYLLNDMILSEQCCNQLMSSIGKTFKHKVGLANTIPNNVLYNKLEYGLQHIFERQVQLHASNWTSRVNSSNISGEIARHRLQELQNAYWFPNSIITNCHKVYPKSEHNLTHDILWILKSQGIIFTSCKIRTTPSA